MNQRCGNNFIGPVEELEGDFDGIQHEALREPRFHKNEPGRRERLGKKDRLVVEGKARINKLRTVIADSIHDEVGKRRALALLDQIQATQGPFEEIARSSFAPRNRIPQKIAVRDPISEPTWPNHIENVAELSACIVHEVNQPLTSVVANASAALRWLARDTPDLDKVRECLTEVVTAGHYAGDVLANVRAMFKNDVSEQDPVDVNGLIGTVLGLVQPELTKYEIALGTQLSEHIPLIRGNRVQLQQVIMNLVMNAIQSMWSVKPRVLRIRSDLIKPGTVRVSIEDTGIGIDPSNLDRIFESRFTTKSGGMGMGLTICRSIIERHNGQIWVSSIVNNGSTFQFELPTADFRSI